MLTPKLIPMEKMEQLEKASKEQQAKGLDRQVTEGMDKLSPGDQRHASFAAGERDVGGHLGDGSYADPDTASKHEEASERGGERGRKTRASRALRRELQDPGGFEEDSAFLPNKPLKNMQKQRLDNAAVQLEKIFGFRRTKDPSKTEAQEQRAHGTWDTKWRERDADKKRVARQRQQVKDVAGAPGRAAGKAAGAAAGAAYEATGAAERGAKRAGSLFSRAFGAGKRKAKDVAGAPGRRQERKAAERHQSNLRQQATARRVAASEDRRDARKQSPTTVQQGRTGYTNGHDTGLGGKQGERSAAIPKFDSPSKIQQTDAAAGKAPQQPKPFTPPAKPKWGEEGFATARGDWKKMQKAMISLQKYLDDCGCEGDTLMQNKDDSAAKPNIRRIAEDRWVDADTGKEVFEPAPTPEKKSD